MDYLNMLERLYIFDGFAGWDPEVSWFFGFTSLSSGSHMLNRTCAERMHGSFLSQNIKGSISRVSVNTVSSISTASWPLGNS